jgi:transcriptional regulator with XRE-family HTH domain
MEKLGQKLKFYRKLRRMSLRDVAHKADCSPSFLSLVELDRASPTIKSLEKICRALDMTVADFLRKVTVTVEPLVIPKDREKCQVAMRWGGSKLLQVLPPEAHNPFTALVLRLEEKGSVPPRHAPHSLMQLCIVLQGRVECQIGNRSFPLSAGESLYFDLSQVHEWSNVGTGEAEILLMSPSAFSLFEQVEEDVRWHVREKKQRRKEKRDG